MLWNAKLARLRAVSGKPKKWRLVYSFDIQMPNGIHEVNVDAHSGKILEDHIESPPDEAKEKAQEKQN